MKVVLIKDSHVGKKGEVKDFPDPRANYLIRVGLVHKIKKDEPEKQAIKKDVPVKRAKNESIGCKNSVKH